jgi:hypothetical protein
MTTFRKHTVAAVIKGGAFDAGYRFVVFALASAMLPAQGGPAWSRPRALPGAGPAEKGLL